LWADVSGRFLVVLPRLGVDLGGDGWWLKVFSANVFQDRPGGLKLSVGGVGVVVMDPQASPPFPPSLPGTVLDRLRVLGEEVAALGDAELWRLSDAESVEAVRRSFVLLQQYEFVRLGLVLDLDQRPGAVATVRTGTTAGSFLRGRCRGRAGRRRRMCRPRRCWAPADWWGLVPARTRTLRVLDQGTQRPLPFQQQEGSPRRTERFVPKNSLRAVEYSLRDCTDFGVDTRAPIGRDIHGADLIYWRRGPWTPTNRRRQGSALPPGRRPS
jgi:hypothetical protein